MSALSYVLKVHDAIYKATGGRIGHKVLGGVPSLLLHTTGRKSGEPRVTALTYLQDGENWVVVASKGGADTAPAWLLNLRANPEAKVQVGTKTHPATARVLMPEDPDYARLWAGANKINGNRYDAYQAKTQRKIPLVVLSPR